MKTLAVADLMTPCPAFCVPTESLEQVARQMAEQGCDAIPVVDDPLDRRPVGVITDRDLVVRVLAQGESILDCQVRDVMTPAPAQLHVNGTFHDCTRLMRLYEIRRLLVVDDRCQLIGIVTIGDLARACGEDPHLEHEVATVLEVPGPERLTRPSPAELSVVEKAVVGEATRSARPLGY